MSPEPAIEFDGVTKEYRVRSGRAAILDVLRPSTIEHRRALTEVSFSVVHGERVGIVGDNGAGKTTALRLMTRIARPTRGTVTMHGTVGALLEVGSGINPEMSARDNIALYGNILGHSRRDVAKRFDQIVEFAELAHVLDQQVKYFSSGMQLRLGFAIASHLEPDILIVDEALAVGDVRFQRKCIARMNELTGRGTTLIYVSHDLRTVEALCDRVLWLDQGRLLADDATGTVLADYLESTRVTTVHLDDFATGDDVLTVRSVVFRDPSGEVVDKATAGRALTIEILFSGPTIAGPQVAVGFSKGGIEPFLVCSMAEDDASAPAEVSGEWTCRLEIDHLPLRRGLVEVWLGVLGPDTMTELVAYKRLASLAVEGAVGTGRRALTELGPVAVPHRFSVEG